MIAPQFPAGGSWGYGLPWLRLAIEAIDSLQQEFKVDPGRLYIINERMPRTHGYTALSLRQLTAFMHSDRPLPGHAPEPETPEVGRIGDLVAGRVDVPQPAVPGKPQAFRACSIIMMKTLNS
jgi:hypothetical protein